MLVSNRRDHRVINARLAQLKAALRPESVVDEVSSNLSAEVAAARRMALEAEIEKLQRDLDNYEKLQSIRSGAEDLAVSDLGLLPIVARIARRLSQRELADLVGVSEQQIQRYESDRYSSVSLHRYEKILGILGLEIQHRLSPFWSDRKSSQEETQSNNSNFELDAATISEIRKGDWLSLPRGISPDDAAQIIRNYIAEGVQLGRARTLFRRYTGENARLNETNIAIWQSRVLRQAAAQKQKFKISKFNIVDAQWLKKLITLSAHSDGPLRAIEFLREQGILVVLVSHLPHTRLDGAAMLLADGTPIIALTLRYDRLDSFWFTLLHEVGHILLHFHRGLESGFIDDLDEKDSDSREREANLFASSAFIPDEVWETAPARFSRSPESVQKMAASLDISPAVIAGRIRKERGDYKIFSDLIGNGLVRGALKDQFT